MKETTLERQIKAINAEYAKVREALNAKQEEQIISAIKENIASGLLLAEMRSIDLASPNLI